LPVVTTSLRCLHLEDITTCTVYLTAWNLEKSSVNKKPSYRRGILRDALCKLKSDTKIAF